MVNTPSLPVVAPHGDDDRDAIVHFAGLFSGIPRLMLRLRYIAHQDNVPPRPLLRPRPWATHLILPMRPTPRRTTSAMIEYGAPAPPGTSGASDRARDARACQLHNSLFDDSSTYRHTCDRARRTCTFDWVHRTISR